MTISTIEELEVLPVGAAIGVGSNADRRAENVWQRVEAGLHRNGLTLPPSAFSAEVSNGSVRQRRQQGGANMEAGQVYHRRGSAWTYIILDRATTEDRSTGWWVVRFSTAGHYDSLRVESEMPGAAAARPDWYDTALSMGNALLAGLRLTNRLERERHEATERLRVGDEAAGRAAEEVRETLSTALLAYCEENHIKPDDPLVQVMRDNGLRTPAITVPVTVTVNCTVRVPLSQQELRDKYPAGVQPWRDDINQFVYLYFTKDVVVNVETNEPGRAYGLVTWNRVHDALRAEGIETYQSEIVRFTCPRH